MDLCSTESVLRYGMNEFLKLVENDDPNFKEKLINELTMARDDHYNKANDGFHNLNNGTYYGPHTVWASCSMGPILCPILY